MSTIVLLILLICSDAYSQLFYVGVKGGTPLSPSTSSAFVGDYHSGSGLSTLNIRRYTVGPTVEISLPFRLRFEADVLYKRLDRTEHRFLGPSFGNIYRNAANAWEFPLLLKYPLCEIVSAPSSSPAARFDASSRLMPARNRSPMAFSLLTA